ncbi:LCP family protein [Mobilicoccus sp.]|uniref:LCP family protein n=1 Tax=Mobilicoccus sp. TaxID=2034349 RepID=UPI0028AA28C2|nr:LCP family protein [Mobilicoccus sp.]
MSSGNPGVPGPEPRRGLGALLGLTTLGAILPGSGLLLSGRRWLGGLMLSAFVLSVVGAAAFVYVKGPTEVALFLGVRRNLLLVLVMAGIVALVLLAASLVHTAALNWPSRPETAKRALAGVFTSVLVLGVLAPAAPAMQYVMIHRDTVSSIFSHGDVRRGAGAATPIGSGKDAWRNSPRVNVMLIGSDAYPGRPGIRTDSMMVASIDTVTGDTVLFGIPRNLENVPLGPGNPLSQVYPKGYDCGDECLLNEVWNEGDKHKDLFPGDPMPGLTATRLALSEILGLGIDYAVVIDIRGFSALVDAMGGVDITVKERIPIGGKVKNGQIVPGSINGWIEPGPQHMDGYTAMWFARSRATTDDFNRMGRQRCMVGAIVRQVDPATMLERYPELAKVARDHVYTDVPPEHLPAWAELVSRIQNGKIRSLPFTNKIVKVTDPDYDHIHEVVQNAISPHPTEGVPAPTGSTPRSTPTPRPSSSLSPGEPAQGLVDVKNAC